jgi:hypothetical protein
MTQWGFLPDNATMFKPILLTLGVILSFPAKGQLATSQSQFMTQFQSSRVSFPSQDSALLASNPGRYPVALAFLMGLAGWTPDGKGQISNPECRPEVWQEKLQDSRIRSSVHLQGAIIQKYFQQCEKDLVVGPTGEFANARKMLSVRQDIPGNSFLKKVIVQLPGNIRVKGLLGLKGDMKRRPFVILRLGIFSNSDEMMAERPWYMMLFEQSPFNILVVENMSGSDFIANNKKIAFGGYDEGIQNIHLAKILQDPLEPLSQIVESVHVMGVSLGGHGVLFSSLLNEYNSQGSHPLIQSFFAYCPVVDLKSSLDHLIKNGLKSRLFDIWAERRMANLKDYFPDLNNFPAFHFMDVVVKKLATNYKGGLSYLSSLRLPPGMEDNTDFWDLNNYWNHYRDVQSPVLIVSTQKDTLVPFAMNSQTLTNKKSAYNSKNIKVVDLPEGYHCTLPVVYDWQALTAIMQGYVLSHSPKFQTQEQNFQLDMKEEWPTEFFAGSAELKFEVSWPEKNKNFVAFEIQAKNQAGQEQEFNISLPLSQFDFKFRDAEISKAEQQMMTRWLNQNFKLALQGTLLKATWSVAR